MFGEPRYFCERPCCKQAFEGVVRGHVENFNLYIYLMQYIYVHCALWHLFNDKDIP